MSDLKKFSDALKTWRIQKNLTQKEVADRMGISRSVLSFLENGVQYPKMKHLVLLKERCGLDLSHTITGNDSIIGNQVSEPRPYFGSPAELPKDMAAIAEMINTRSEVKKDIVIIIRLMNQMEEEFRALTLEGRKNLNRIKDMLLECQMML
jgi:transcriptional regulator with XRE-family HTH domain